MTATKGMIDRKPSNINSGKPIAYAYDPASHEGDVSVMAFRKGDEIIGHLTGDAAEYVYFTIVQLEAELKAKRDNDND